MEFLINIDVSDLDEATRFYQSAFELRIGRRFGSDFVELLGGPAPIYLLAKPAGTATSIDARHQRSYERHWTPVHLDIVVDDIDAAVARACGAGARLEQPVLQREWGRLALMADPFGHGFCLLQFEGRGYDAIAD